jgi:uncharacterized DUF497 family protein
VGFEWDPKKARSNEKKHGVSFADAATAFDDDLALTIEEPDGEDEQRFVTLAMDSSGSLLVIVYTWRRENIRIISARKATKRERRIYEGGS